MSMELSGDRSQERQCYGYISQESCASIFQIFTRQHFDKKPGFETSEMVMEPLRGMWTASRAVQRMTETGHCIEKTTNTMYHGDIAEFYRKCVYVQVFYKYTIYIYIIDIHASTQFKIFQNI